MAFLIAWGWREIDGSCQTRHLVAASFTRTAEADLISRWQLELTALAQRFGLSLEQLRLFHWGSQVQEIPSPSGEGKRGGLRDLPWFDLLENVIHKEPLAVRGAFTFGLYDLAAALQRAGVIDTAVSRLPSLPSMALSVMAGAWSAQDEAKERACPLAHTEPMALIAEYASSSCRSMMELVALLRARASRQLLKAA